MRPFVTLALWLFTGHAAATEARFAWAPEDSVALRHIVTHQFLPGYWWTQPGEPVIASKDGQRFFFVTHHGDVSCDCNIYTLRVFEANDVLAALARESGKSLATPEPMRSVSLRSASNEPAIGNARWDERGDITFIGVEDDGRQRVLRLDVESGRMTALSPGAVEMNFYQQRGDGLIFDSVEYRPLQQQLEYPVTAMTASNAIAALGASRNAIYTLYASYGQSAPVSLAELPFGGGASLRPILSPDGTKAVMMLPSPSGDIPAAWSSYGRAKALTPQNFSRFLIVDLPSMRIEPMLDAPSGKSVEASWVEPAALWSADGRHVILVNTALPLNEDPQARQRSAYVVAYEVATKKWTALQPLELSPPASEAIRVRSIGWRENGSDLLITHVTQAGKPAPGMSYRLRQGQWKSERTPPSLQPPSPFFSASGPVSAGGLQLSIRQDANHAPIVMATHSSPELGSRELALLEPDPALQSRRFVESRPVQWTEGGKTVVGGLRLPRTGRGPWPLVIQAYQYAPDHFRPDGPSPTAYAAQSLVARGMAVLEVDIIDLPGASTPRESEAFVERIDAAVASLAAQGLADPTRVGLVGFSRAGFLTYYAITHPGRTTLAAAVSADGWSGGYGAYLFEALLSGETRIRSSVSYYETQMGGGSPWENPGGWREHSPGFNAHRVRTPTLFMRHGRFSHYVFYETIAAFQLNDRPVEFMILPEGSHQLIRPRERAASMQATVDWMAFWLQGQQSAQPESADRNERWRAMRRNWETTRRTLSGSPQPASTAATLQKDARPDSLMP